MLKTGDKLPEFIGTTQDEKRINSKDFLGNKLIIFFYPRANTPGCTAEACNLSDHISELKNAGYSILGISADTVEKQKKFHDKFGFKYDLIADESKEICNLFGVWQLKKFMGKESMGIVRTTFIFDENSICTRVIDKVKTKEAAEQILSF